MTVATPTRCLTLLTTLLGLGGVACDVPMSEQELVAFPAQASMALRGDLEVRISLTDAQLDGAPLVTVTGGGRTWTPACTVDRAERMAVCEPIADLPEGVDYEIVMAAVDGTTLTRDVSSMPPSRGEAWMLTDALQVDTFGGNANSRGVLDLLLERSSILGVLADGHFLVGPVKDLGDAVRIQAPGLGFALPVHVDEEGELASDIIDGFLPLSVDGESAHAYVLDAQITGSRQGGDLAFQLTGAFPAATVEQLASLVGVFGELVVAELTYDVDSDGDGVMDAVSFSISGLARGTTLKAWGDTFTPDDSSGLGVAL